VSETIELPNLLSEAEYQKLSPADKEVYIKEILRKTLEKNPEGITIRQLTKEFTFDRRIIEKHLEVMQFTNEIYTIKLGSNKLYIPNHKAMHEATSHFARFGHHEYQVYTLRNRLGNFVIIQQRKASKESQEITGGLQIPLEDYDKFVDYLKRTITDMERRGLK
jgi:DNA-binding LacI/PurR family transcriptional regulator